MSTKQLPAIGRDRLPNGVRVLTQEMPGSESVSLGVWVENGSRFETPAENGISHFLEHVIFKGTERRNAFEIAAAIESVGGDLNAFTTKEHTCYYARVLAEDLDLAVDVLADIYAHSVFDPAELERERGVILQEIAETEDDPEDLLFEQFDAGFWGDHSLARPICGTASTVRSFSREDVLRFLEERYTPARTIVVGTGSVDQERFAARIGESFGALTGDAPDRVSGPPATFPGVQVDDRDFEQVHVALAGPGLIVGAPERWAGWLLDIVLGDGMSSRLFQEIRERRGLAYSVYSFQSSYRDTGMCGVYASTAPADVAEVVEVLLAELAKVAAHGLADGELARAKTQAKGGFRLGLESPDSHMSRVAQGEIYFDGADPPATVLERIDAVTEDEVATLARRLFVPDAMRLALLGPIPKGLQPEALLGRSGTV